MRSVSIIKEEPSVHRLNSVKCQEGSPAPSGIRPDCSEGTFLFSFHFIYLAVATLPSLALLPPPGPLLHSQSAEKTLPLRTLIPNLNRLKSRPTVQPDLLLLRSSSVCDPAEGAWSVLPLGSYRLHSSLIPTLLCRTGWSPWVGLTQEAPEEHRLLAPPPRGSDWAGPVTLHFAFPPASHVWCHRQHGGGGAVA